MKFRIWGALTPALLLSLAAGSEAAAASGSPLGAREAQIIRSVERQTRLPAGRIKSVGFDHQRKRVTFLAGRDLAGQEVPDAAAAHALAERLKAVWGLNAGKADELRFVRTIRDDKGDVHAFAQHFRGVPVFDRAIRVSVDPSDRVFVVASNLHGIPAGFNLSPALTVDEAVTYVEGARGTYIEEFEAELGIRIHEGTPRLAYRLLAQLESGKLFHFQVDAMNGDVLSATPDEIPAGGNVTGPAVDELENDWTINIYKYDGGRYPVNNVLGQAFSLFSNGRKFVRTAAKGPYNLTDTTRSYGGWIYGIDVANNYDMVQNTSPDFSDPSFGPYISAYTGMGMSLDYFYDTYGRESFDEAGAAVVTLMQRPDYFNASWSRSGYYITFGQGDGVSYRSFAVDAQVAGHELSHAFTQFTSGLDYADQPGAINEANSDIMGWSMVALDQYEATGDLSVFNEWTIGALIYLDGRSAIRDMINPQRISQIDHMAYYICGGDPHYNSSIPNLAFVRLVQGNAGTGTTVSISPLEASKPASVKAAAQLFYDVNTRYLTATSTFNELWQGLVAAVPSGKTSYVTAINATFNSLGVCSDGTNNCNAAAGATVDPHITNMGSVNSQYMGSYLSNTADFDGDGYMDVIGRRADINQEDPALTYTGDLFFGKSTGGFDAPVNVGYTGGNGGQAFALADLNKDGLAEVILGALNATGVGEVSIIAGNRNRTVTTVAGKVSTGVTADGFATAVAPAGDVNKDGYNDFVVGAPKDTSGSGKAYVVLGAASLTGLKLVALPTPADAVAHGSWVNGVGDVNGDGFADVVVLGKVDALQGIASKGRLYLGSASFTGTTGVDLEPGNRVMGVGDLNRDGRADFVVNNTVYKNGSAENAGRTVVYYGAASPTSPMAIGLTLTGKNVDEYYGRFAGGADLNNDGYSDLFVTHFETPYMRRGIVDVFPGSSTGVKATPSKQWFGNYGSASFGYGISRRRDSSATSDALVISAPAYLPWDAAQQCRTEFAGAFYRYTGADM